MQLSKFLALFLFFFKILHTNSETRNVTISKYEFCEGCRELVNLYSKLSSESLLKMHQKGVKAFSDFEASSIINLICDNIYFNSFKEFVKYSCIKIIENYSTQLLENFKGSYSATSLINKKEIYKITKRVCQRDIKACRKEDFVDPAPKDNISKKCVACQIISSDIEKLRYKLVDEKVLRNHLENDFCNRIGFGHQPYNWLEEVCDEMMDDKIDDILDIISFHKKVSQTGFKPDQTLPEMICDEFYKCGKFSSPHKEL